MSENLPNEYSSGSNILEIILQGLWLPHSDAGYQRLIEILNTDYGVIITVEELRIMEQEKPAHSVLKTMMKWPWKYAADEDCQEFSKMLRVAAQQAGLKVREE
jgi:hypothetical protein